MTHVYHDYLGYGVCRRVCLSLFRKNVGCDVRVARFLQYNIYSSGIELQMFGYFNKARIIRLI